MSTSSSDETLKAADAAVRELGWDTPYFVDADHINLNTVSRYIVPCDFFTLDVADRIGKPADPQDVARFIQSHPELVGAVSIPNVELPFKNGSTLC